MDMTQDAALRCEACQVMRTVSCGTMNPPDSTCVPFGNAGSTPTGNAGTPAHAEPAFSRAMVQRGPTSRLIR